MAGRVPGRAATLIVPSNYMWEPANGPAAALPIAPPALTPESAVHAAAQLLRNSSNPVLLMGGIGTRERGLRAAARIVAACGCRRLCETFPARGERGPGLPVLEKLPYFPDLAIQTLSQFDSVVIAGAREPVSFFGYPDSPSRLIPEGRPIATLAAPEQDVPAALEALADAVGHYVFVSTISVYADPSQPVDESSAVVEPPAPGPGARWR